jgi:hypothetical protein
MRPTQVTASVIARGDLAVVPPQVANWCECGSAHVPQKSWWSRFTKCRPSMVSGSMTAAKCHKGASVRERPGQILCRCAAGRCRHRVPVCTTVDSGRGLGDKAIQAEEWRPGGTQVGPLQARKTPTLARVEKLGGVSRSLCVLSWPAVRCRRSADCLGGEPLAGGPGMPRGQALFRRPPGALAALEDRVRHCRT